MRSRKEDQRPGNAQMVGATRGRGKVGAPRGPSQEKNHTDLPETLEQVEGICIPLTKVRGKG